MEMRLTLFSFLEGTRSNQSTEHGPQESMWERGQDKDRTGETEKRGRERFLPNMSVHSFPG